MQTRKQIISLIKDTFIDNENVNAFWLEGADGLGKVDEYSDIDMVLDVKDGEEDNVFKKAESVLSSLGKLDLNEEDFVDHPKIRTKFYHIENTSQYLIIDFSIQSASRNKKESIFTDGDKISFPKIVFDKIGLVKIKASETVDYSEKFKERIEIFKSRYKQHSRVLKYVERDQFLEAYMYYGKYVSQPIVELMRMKYSPKYHYLYLIHISEHIPNNDKEILEKLFKVSSLEDISNNVKYAQKLFKKLIEEIEKLYII